MKLKLSEVKEALASANAGLEALRQPKRAQTAIAMNPAFCILKAIARSKPGATIQVEA